MVARVNTKTNNQVKALISEFGGSKANFIEFTGSSPHLLNADGKELD